MLKREDLNLRPSPYQELTLTAELRFNIIADTLGLEPRTTPVTAERSKPIELDANI